MANKKYETGQVLTKLRQVEQLCKQHKTIKEAAECVGIDENIYYRWRERYGWMTMDEYRKMRDLENENEKLKALMRLWVATVGEADTVFATEKE